MINTIPIIKGITIICIALLSSFYLAAQSIAKSTPINAASEIENTSPEIQPLSIGDKVPDIFFENVFNYKTKKAKLSDFRGKLVILDFWATWCTSCLHNFPKIDSLQKHFNDKLQILLVNNKNTKDNKANISHFYDKWKKKNLSDFQLPTVVEDTITDVLFPHKLIPHYVWIAADGTVKAITSSDQVTMENIQKVLAEEDIRMPIKRDVDTENPLFINNDMVLQKISHHSIFLKGKIDGLPSGNSFKRNGKVLYGRAIMNMPILRMYEIIISNLFPDYHFNPRKMILEISDSTKQIFDKTSIDYEYNRENLFTYELIVPLSQAGKLYSYMLDDLNRYSGLYGRVEKRKVKCLILIRTNEIDKVKTKGGYFEDRLFSDQNQYLKNAPIANLLLRLNNIENIKLPVIDETNYKGNIDIELPVDFNNMIDLRKKLKQYGLDLVESEKFIEMFVLTEK